MTPNGKDGLMLLATVAIDEVGKCLRVCQERASTTMQRKVKITERGKTHVSYSKLKPYLLTQGNTKYVAVCHM